MSEINKKLSEALLRAGTLEGVVSEHGEDEIAVRCGHFDDYLIVFYLGRLLERGEMEIKVSPSRMNYLLKLLKIDRNMTTILKNQNNHQTHLQEEMEDYFVAILKLLNVIHWENKVIVSCLLGKDKSKAVRNDMDKVFDGAIEEFNNKCHSDNAE